MFALLIVLVITLFTLEAQQRDKSLRTRQDKEGPRPISTIYKKHAALQFAVLGAPTNRPNLAVVDRRYRTPTAFPLFRIPIQ